MEFVLLGLLGLAVTWGVVEAVRDDDDSAPEPEGPDPDDVLIAESHSILNAGGEMTPSSPTTMATMATGLPIPPSTVAEVMTRSPSSVSQTR